MQDKYINELLTHFRDVTEEIAENNYDLYQDIARHYYSYANPSSEITEALLFSPSDQEIVDVIGEDPLSTQIDLGAVNYRGRRRIYRVEKYYTDFINDYFKSLSLKWSDVNPLLVEGSFGDHHYFVVDETKHPQIDLPTLSKIVANDQSDVAMVLRQAELWAEMNY